MNPITFALRRPVTIATAMVALIAAGWFAYSRMKIDIFPSLNLPVVYVCQPYGGMDPSQMEGLIANYYEYHFLYIGGIHHVESKNVQGVSLMKLYFHPGTDMAQALAETVGYVNRSRAFMPPGTVPPFIMRFDTGSVPVGYLVLSSETKSIGQIQDQALFKVRPMFASIPGVSAPPPFGGNQRTVVLRIDPGRLQAYKVSPDDVIKALSSGNTISPSGSVRTVDSMPLVPINSTVAQPKELGEILVAPGVFMRDVAPTIEDASDIPTGYALVNGKRAVYILATKRAEASTLSVVEGIRANLSKMQAVLPDDIRVSFEFDQSPYVTNSMRNVMTEALLGALLTGLMVLLFLRDWRTVIVVVLNIPLALIASLVAMSMAGQSINLMTLGGLALAVGILVDEATVEVENIHTQLDKGMSVAMAVRAGNAETAVPRLLALMCVLAVFIPAFFMQGSAQALFVPLSLAVGFAMIASYILSSTLVPVLSVWLMRGRTHTAVPPRDHSRSRFAVPVRHRWIGVPLYFIITTMMIFGTVRIVGTEIFPTIDAGQFQFRLRAPVGTRIEQTEAITKEALEEIKRIVGPENVEITLGYVGVVPSSYPINSVFLWMGGPEESVMRVSLKKGTAHVETVKRQLRERLLPHLQSWLDQKWKSEGIDPQRVERRVRELKLSFEPADIVNEVMSFGSPTPVEVQVSGPKMADNREFAAKVFDQLNNVPSLRDVQYSQALDYPTFEVTINREKAGFSGVTAEDVSRSLVAGTSSSRFVVPNYWRDLASGIGYQVQVEIPQSLMKSMRDIEMIPVKGGHGKQWLLRDVAEVKEGSMPGEIDRYNMRRVVSMTANIDGEDLGRVAQRIAQALTLAGTPPTGVTVDVRGQVSAMKELLHGLRFGLIIAVVVTFLVLVAYFQSVRLAIISVSAIPAVLAGVGVALIVTGTTLNLQSFMGAIMAIGVAVANAILLVTFADRSHRSGRTAVESAINAVGGRVRPILMTSFAMIAGMIPMAVGSDQTAPLARAVIGGLIASTFATLFALPAIYAILMSFGRHLSASLDPTDPTSRYYTPAHNPEPTP